MSKGIMTNGITTSEETYYFTKGYEQGRADVLNELWLMVIRKYAEVLSLEELDECIGEMVKEHSND